MTDEETVECDLPGCLLTEALEDEEEFPPQPPPGWFSVVVGRHGAEVETLVYCSHDHLGRGVTEHLPEVRPVEDVASGSWDGALAGTVVLSLLAVFVLGIFTAVMLLVDLAGWLVDRV